MSNNETISWNSKVVKFNHKVMIRVLKSRHHILWTLENLMICENLGKMTSYIKERHITLVHLIYSKLHC